MARQSHRNAALESNTVVPRVPDTTADHLVHESYISYEAREEVSVTIVDVIAEIRDQPLTELVPRIDGAVDPDALDRIVRPLPDGTPRTGVVTFSVSDCLVRLHGDGLLRIYDSSERPVDRPTDPGGN